MQSSKRNIYAFSFAVLYCLLFKIDGTYCQTGKKSREQCLIYKRAGPDSPNEYPHVAALGYGNERNRKWGCGGTLISNNFVLTAAHCLDSRSEGEVQLVRLGTKNAQKPTAESKDLEISEKIPYPQYKPPQRYDDIALLRLKTSVAFTSKIKPACLGVDTSFDTSSLSVAGWGNQGNQLKVNLNMYNESTCSSSYKDLKKEFPFGVQLQSMICAGGPRNQDKNTCPGDSGGPLQVLVAQKYYVVRVSSFGNPCGQPKMPGIYTRIAKYASWIENIVWK